MARRDQKMFVTGATGTTTLLAGLLFAACQPLEQTDEPVPVAPAPLQSPAAAPLSPQCDDVKIKCAPQGGFAPSLIEACKVKFEKGDPSICVQPTWPMELFNELNNAVASGGGECVTMFVTGTTSGLKLREQPNTSGAVVDGANEGDEVCSLSNAGPDWAKVRYKGKVGYMSRQFLATRGSNTPGAGRNPTTTGSTGPKRDCSKFKDTVACKVNKSNQNCWLKVPDRVYNGMPVVDDDLTLVTSGQVACYARPETLRVAWGPFFMHRPALMRWSPELMCYVETSNLDCP